MATPKLALDKANRQYYACFDGKKACFGRNCGRAAQRFAESLTRWANGEPIGKRRTVTWSTARVT